MIMHGLLPILKIVTFVTKLLNIIRFFNLFLILRSIILKSKNMEGAFYVET